MDQYVAEYHLPRGRKGLVDNRVINRVNVSNNSEDTSLNVDCPAVSRLIMSKIYYIVADYGHAGYTGTIAEKSEYCVIKECEKGVSMKEAAQKVNEMLSAADTRIDDKWGPAGAIRVIDPDHKQDGWLFFGWASS